MVFRVEIQPQAFEDLDSIAAYLVSQSSFAVAERWFNGILDEIASLKEMPARWPIAAESIQLGHEIRVLLYGRKRRAYKVFYSIQYDAGTQAVVQVHHVRHWARKPAGAEDLKEMLER